MATKLTITSLLDQSGINPDSSLFSLSRALKALEERETTYRLAKIVVAWYIYQSPEWIDESYSLGIGENFRQYLAETFSHLSGPEISAIASLCENVFPQLEYVFDIESLMDRALAYRKASVLLSLPPVFKGIALLDDDQRYEIEQDIKAMVEHKAFEPVPDAVDPISWAVIQLMFSLTRDSFWLQMQLWGLRRTATGDLLITDFDVEYGEDGIVISMTILPEQITPMRKLLKKVVVEEALQRLTNL